MNIFKATWSEPLDMLDDITYEYLVIADSLEEAEMKIKKKKNVSQNLKITEYEHEDGIIFIGAK